MLAWVKWDTPAISAVLTELCFPFYRLRLCEFADEQNPGPHLSILNKRAKALSYFVTTSILAAAMISKSDAKSVVEKWLEIAHDLASRNNYHMLFAIQNGLAKHQVDRIEWLWEGLSSRAKKEREDLNAFFNHSDRMKRLTDASKEFAGKKSMIPCLYWFVQKATLLKETPLFLPNRKLNLDKLIAASNIFSDMVQMREVNYEPLKVPEEVLSYFTRLELEYDSRSSDEELYVISDNVCQGAPKFGALTLKKKPVSYDTTLDSARSLMPKKSQSVPNSLTFLSTRK